VPVQYSYTSTPAIGRTAYTNPQCLYSRAIPLLPLSAVQPLQTLSACTVSATPLVPLWAVRPVQTLSSCTVHLYLYSPYGPYSLYRVSVPVRYSYTSTPPMGRTASTEPQCLYSTSIPLLPLWAVQPLQSLSACTVQLYLYSPYGPYGLYSISVPVQYSYTSTLPMGPTACRGPQCLYSTAIRLIPLWAVRSLQSLSACTLHLYLYSPYGPYSLYSFSVPVQYSYTSTPPMARTASTESQCLYSTAIPLLPLWAVRPLQNLSACTVQLYLYSPYGPYRLYRPSVPVQCSYTSTLPMGRTASTESQCLYSTAIPLLPLWAVRPVESLSACTRMHFTFLPLLVALVVKELN